MAGHSKWVQIKRQKGAADIKRGQTFTKIANAISVAVKTGGTADPGNNIRLRIAMDQAKAANMPKENITRAIERALGTFGGDRPIEEAIYEGFGPGGVGFIIQAATDNKQRTLSAIKNVLQRSGGQLATPGAVSWQFQKQLLVRVVPKEVSSEEAILALIDAGVHDVETVENTILAYTLPENLASVRDRVADKGTILSVELVLRPTTSVPINDPDTARKVLSLVDTIEEQEDVQQVFANFDIPEELLGKVARA